MITREKSCRGGARQASNLWTTAVLSLLAFFSRVLKIANTLETAVQGSLACLAHPHVRVLHHVHVCVCVHVALCICSPAVC